MDHKKVTSQKIFIVRMTERHYDYIQRLRERDFAKKLNSHIKYCVKHQTTPKSFENLKPQPFDVTKIIEEHIIEEKS